MFVLKDNPCLVEVINFIRFFCYDVSMTEKERLRQIADICDKVESEDESC